MDKVTILMATYNGDKYLKEQINSIINQTFTNWELYIRDDGSSDDSIDIIKEYEKNDQRIKLIDAGIKRLGTTGNFNMLMNLSPVKEYIMFCDQDDVWLPGKVELTMKSMIQAEEMHSKATPLLIHTDLRVVDSNLKLIAQSHKKFAGLSRVSGYQLGLLLAQPYVFGCTMMINKSLYEASKPIPPEAEMHDCWISLVAAALGEVIFIEETTILYRQHSSNVSGSASGSLLINRLKRMLNWSEIDNIVTLRLKQGLVLKIRLGEKLDAQIREMLDGYYQNACKGGWQAVLSAIRFGVVRQGFLRTLIFYISLFKKDRSMDMEQLSIKELNNEHSNQE